MNNKRINLQRNMSQKLFLTAICALLTLSGIKAQTCTIIGSIENDTLCHAPERIKKVYLTQMDEYERYTQVDSAKVKNGKFTFKYKLNPNEPVVLYFITGFDNGSIPLFVENGNINVQLKNAAYPVSAKISGTPNNDLYTAYKAISERCIKIQNDKIHEWEKQYGEIWLNSPEGTLERNRFGAGELIDCNAEKINFLLAHNDSPLAPLMMEREIYHLSPGV